jgi:site-specific recombinase XerD
LCIKVLAMTRSAGNDMRREMGAAHLRFYRAAMDSVPLAKAWDLYLPLETEFSDAAAQATLAWVRHTLIGEALAAGRADLIGLFRRDPQRMRGGGQPTLDEFAQRYQDAGEFSQAELLALWQDLHGKPSSAEARRERLARRLREALALLDRGVRRQPAAPDVVGRWLAPQLAQRLANAGLRTLGQLAAALASRRSPRWPEVPGIGAVGADRLAAWLAEHAIGPAASSGAAAARTDAAHRPDTAPGVPATSAETPGLPALQLLPLERFQPGPELLPARPPSPALPGANLLGARDDKHAIELWLQARAGNPHTHRAYRKNAERLLLWCHLERRTSLREMTVADCIHYRQWLLTLGRQTAQAWAAAGWRIPAEQWIGTRRAARRDSADWRPFDGPLGADSVAQDLLVVKALFGFLLKAGYLAHQPWDLLGKLPRAADRLADASEQFVERSLDAAQWDWLVQGLQHPAGDRQARLRAVLWLGYGCGLRAAEMLSLTLASLQPRAAGWRLRVLGKGGKARTVPLPTPVRDAVLDYLCSVGLALDMVLQAASQGQNSAVGQQPLLRAQRGRRSPGREPPSSALRYSTLYGDLKAYLAQRAADLGASDPVASAKFRQASTHWLRHTCATLALRSGVPINAVQRVLGHASLQTTSHYLTEQQDALQTAMEGFAAAPPAGMKR